MTQAYSVNKIAPVQPAQGSYPVQARSGEPAQFM